MESDLNLSHRTFYLYEFTAMITRTIYVANTTLTSEP